MQAKVQMIGHLTTKIQRSVRMYDGLWFIHDLLRWRPVLGAIAVWRCWRLMLVLERVAASGNCQLSPAS